MRKIPDHRFHSRLETDALGWLLTTKNKSPFLCGIRNQLKLWLLGEHPDYDSPLSERQWTSLLNAYGKHLDRLERSKEYEARLQQLTESVETKQPMATL